MPCQRFLPPLILAACAFALSAAAQSNPIIRIKPAAPKPLQPVSIDVMAPGCGFLAYATMEGNTITVSAAGGFDCSPPPSPTVHEITLGSFPAGEYRVVMEGSNAPPLTFTVGRTPSVNNRAYVQTGIWWDPRHPGTGLTIVDAFPERRVISFSTHDLLRRPVVYTMVLERGQSGGPLYRTDGTPAALTPPTPDASTTPVGEGFLMTMDDGTLVFDYTINPLPGHRLMLERFPL